MKKFITIVSVIICLGLGGLLIANHYTSLKEERFNNIIENANEAIAYQILWPISRRRAV